MRIPSKEYIQRTLNKYYKAHNTKFHIRRFKDGNNPAPNIYNERVGKSYGQPIECYGYLETNPTDIRLEELGWNKEITDFVIKVPYSTLQEAGLVKEDGSLDFTTDDKIEVPSLGLAYRIELISLREPFIDGTPTYVNIGGRKFING